MAEGACVGNVRVRGVNSDLRDVAGFLQTQVRPVLAAVGGLIDTITPGHVVSHLGLAHAHVHDVGVAVGNRNRANRTRAERIITERHPGQTRIGGLPETTGSAVIKPHLVSRVSDDIRTPIPHHWTDKAPDHGVGVRRGFGREWLPRDVLVGDQLLCSGWGTGSEN